MNFEHRDAVGKIVSADTDHENGLHSWAYTSMVGGKPGDYHDFVSLDTLGEMDDWPQTVLIDACGAEKAQRMSKAFAKVSEAHSAVLALDNTMSSLHTPEDGE